MADTYAFALAGAVVLALTVSPVLCTLALKGLQPRPDNRLVRLLQALFVKQLRWLLGARWLVLGGFAAVVAATGLAAARVGREFMPQLEEGGVLIRATFPVNISFDEAVSRSRQFRRLLRQFEEFRVIPTIVGRPDDGTDPTGYYNMEANLPLRPQEDWPIDPKRGRRRTKGELVADLAEVLERHFPGVNFDISQIIRDNVLEALSGVKGENSIKLFGPDLAQLERTAAAIRETLAGVPGVQNAGVFRILGQANLELAVDRQKCARWGVSADDVRQIIESAVAGSAVSTVQEGGKTFDLTVRWPERLRDSQEAILAIPVPVRNQVKSEAPLASATPLSGGGTGISPTGTAQAFPTLTGSILSASGVSPPVAMRRLGDLVTPLDAQGRPDPHGSYLRAGASTIYREQGQRFVAIKFEVRGRDLASTVAEARQRVAPLVKPPYRTEWSGEFRQMEQAEQRMARMFALSMLLIVLMIYLAFRSWLDTAVVLANVAAMAVGGFWALRLAGLNFNISAAVGFISVLGVAVMNGLLLVSNLNRLRAQGVDLAAAIERGTSMLVRPIVMTALAAMLGLLPAALSTKMGSECQKPLAVVVVGGMLCTIACLNLVPVLYSFYGGRTPPAGAGELAH
jgi:cobalt-zinc-cadmium resistance protein CzcA